MSAAVHSRSWRDEFLRILHPSDFRELRAIRGEQTAARNLPADDFAGVDRFATEHAEDNVYVGVATRASASGGRAIDCTALHTLFLDIDFKDTSEGNARGNLEAFPYPPTSIVATGGGLHTYWWLSAPVDLGQVQASTVKATLGALARALGGDLNATDIARVLRLPGSLNQKYSPARRVEIEAFDPNRRYDLDGILQVLSIGGVLDPEQVARAEPLPAVVQAGSRNNVLFREGCRLRRLGWDLKEITAALEAVNRARCRPPLEQDEVRAVAEGCAGYEAAEDVFPQSDTGNAEYFAAALGDCVRHDHGRRAWFVFREHHWWQDRTCEVDRLALETVRARQRAAVGHESALKWAAASESCKRREDLVRLASKIEIVAVTGDQWDQNPWLLGVRNGVIDLRTGALRDGDPADNLTKVAPVAFDEHAECPRWERFLAEVFENQPEIALYMQRVIGYSLTGLTDEQVFWILFGTGSNGKSTLMEVIARHVLGPAYSWTMPFPSAGWSNAMSEYQKASLVGQRFVQASEVSRRGELNEELIKSLTGGDTLNARHPYGRPLTFIPVAKFFLRVNDKPEIHDQSPGMWRRVKLVPFDRRFEPHEVDPTLPETLAAEASGILAWAVRGCLEWQRDGLCHPNAVEAATQEYKAESDPLLRFLYECCLRGEDLSVRAGDLYAEYSRWTEDNDRISQKVFGQRIKAMYRSKEVGRDKRMTYFGIGLLAAGGTTDGPGY